MTTGPSTRSVPDWAVIVLSGGGGRRLGGVAKAAIELVHRTTLDRIIGDLPAHVEVTVAGPRCPTARDVRFAQEDPPDGGPVAGIAAAVHHVRAPMVAIVAVDMPWGGLALPPLVDALRRSGADAAVAVDSDGRRQHLCAAWRTSMLQAAVERLSGGRNEPVRVLVEDVRVEEVALDDSLLVDIDTEADLDRARTLASMSEGAVMQEWIEAVKAELGLSAEVDVDALLDVARVAAHGVARPAAPVTTYLLGLAVGAGADPGTSRAAIDALAAAWAARQAQ